MDCASKVYTWKVEILYHGKLLTHNHSSLVLFLGKLTVSTAAVKYSFAFVFSEAQQPEN